LRVSYVNDCLSYLKGNKNVSGVWMESDLNRANGNGSFHGIFPLFTRSLYI